ncbi:thioredoxin-like protein [Lipomyces oligophaga]|uniref:thioredoxin-like protein n=1 Tax=Lipomyces oligophaga TaxID=45792 RepID=UPI0034CFCEDD
MPLLTNFYKTPIASSIQVCSRISVSRTQFRYFSSFPALKMIKDVKTVEEFRTAINDDKIAVIDFYATWCGPCKMVAPQVHKFSEQFTDGIEFYKVDVDELSEVASEVNVRAMPTFMLFKKGEKIKEIVGANPSALKTAITAALA